MKTFVSFCALVSVVAAGIPTSTLVRTPQFDSAIVKSDRVGGNFAYSTVEGHAYAAISPVVQRVAEPVAVSYTAHQVPLGHITTPVAVSQPLYAHHSIVAQPVFSQQHIFSTPAVISGPAFAQIPSISGIAAAVPVAQPAPVAPAVPAAAAPTPVQGTVVDSDTVAVESA